MRKFLVVILILIVNFWLPQFASAQSKELSKQLKEFDAYVEKSRNQWSAGGLAIDVVKDDDVIFKKSYGSTN